MLIYVFLFLVLLVLSSVEILYQNKKMVIIAGVILAIFAGLRYYTGYDFASYKTFFDEMTGIQDVFNGSLDAETGYLFLNYVFLKLGLNYFTFLLFFACVSSLLLVNFLYRNVPYPTLILMYYFARFFMARDMGQIRGSIASIILLYSVKYMKQRKPFKFLAIVLAASLFHLTALIFILGYIYEVYIADGSTKQALWLFGASVVIGFLVQWQALYLWAIPERYIGYFVNPFYTSGKWLMNPVLWMQLAIYFGSLYFTNIRNDKEFSIYHNLYLLSSVSLIAFGNLSTVGGRLSSPFATYELFVAPYFLLNVTKNKLINWILLIGFTVVIFLIIFVISGDYTSFVPYKTLF